MTADAKVGLLLGLFFIAIIAFLVNGLPNFIRQEHPTVAEAAIKTPSGQDMVPTFRLDEMPHRLHPPRQQPTHPDEPTHLPLKTDTPTPDPKVVVFTPNPHPPKKAAVPSKPIEINSNDLYTPKPEPIVAVKTQSHTVKSGELLSTIAKQYYGDEQGNRFVVIQKLYEANSQVLSSPDKVFEGDKLVIPSLDQLLGTTTQSAQSSQSSQSAQAQVNPASQKPAESKNLLSKFPDVFKKVIGKDKQQVSEYVVQEKDSLWSIAQAKLGDGNRYKEIARLNKIKNVDNVPCGVHLKIPAK